MTPSIEALEPLIGRWRIGVPGAGGDVEFDWLGDKAFVVQRWRSDRPEFPDGIAIIAPDETGDGFVQHYFDSRGVARVYRTTLEDGVWRLWRDAPGFDQRYAGTLADDGATIAGAWEKRTDGATWEHDFELVYTRVPDRLALARASYEAFAAGDRAAIEDLLAADLRFSAPRAWRPSASPSRRCRRPPTRRCRSRSSRSCRSRSSRASGSRSRARRTG